MINVVQLQFSKDTAGKAALRLHDAFIEEGIDSSILSLKWDIINDDKIKFVSKKSRIIARLDKILQSYITRKKIKEYGAFSFPILGTNVSRLDQLKNADVIYIHWVLQGFLNLSNFEQIFKLKKPVIIFMHDMWPITGGCHHSFSCEKYTTGCYNCQVFPGNKKNDLSTKGFNKKSKIFAKYNNIYFISPSKWLYDCAKKSSITKNKPVFHIPNLLDGKIFKPFDKKVAREVLNINTNETIIAFGAVALDSPYKGWLHLQKALQTLYNGGLTNMTVLIFGAGYNKDIENAIPFKVKFVGYLKDEYSVSLVYNAADVFIAPSLAEVFGFVILESLRCGTPVVGFNVGGIPDLIKHKFNGYLAKYKDSEDLANGIKFCIENKLKGSVLPELETRAVLAKHLKLIEEIRM